MKSSISRAPGRTSSDNPAPSLTPINPPRKQRSAGALILNSDNQILLVFQAKGRFWEFPKGKIESGESDDEAMLREIEEEVGLTQLALIPGFDEEIFYKFETPEGTIQKSVRYFAFRTLQKPRMSSEHLEYQWCGQEDALKLLRHENFKRLTRALFAML